MKFDLNKVLTIFVLRRLNHEQFYFHYKLNEARIY